MIIRFFLCRPGWGGREEGGREGKEGDGDNNLEYLGG